MIVVRIELWPHGDASRAELLGEGRITNDAAGSLASGGDLGDYRVELLKGARYSTRPGGVWKAGQVTGFPRRRLGPWDLLYRALRICVGRRNP